MESFEVYRDHVGNYRWRFVARNGRVIADSGEGYVTHADCVHGLDLLRRSAASAPVRDQTRPAGAFGY